jgi:hypothetical protein
MAKNTWMGVYFKGSLQTQTQTQTQTRLLATVFPARGRYHIGEGCEIFVKGDFVWKESGQQSRKNQWQYCMWGSADGIRDIDARCTVGRYRVAEKSRSGWWGWRGWRGWREWRIGVRMADRSSALRWRFAIIRSQITHHMSESRNFDIRIILQSRSNNSTIPLSFCILLRRT